MDEGVGSRVGSMSSTRCVVVLRGLVVCVRAVVRPVLHDVRHAALIPTHAAITSNHRQAEL